MFVLWDIECIYLNIYTTVNSISDKCDSRYFPVNSHAENHPIVKTEKENSSSSLKNNIDHMSEIQETISNLPDSPILRKSKTKSKNNSSDTTLVSPNK